MEEKEIKIGDYVRIKSNGRIGYVSAIKDYGTHVCYFIDLGSPIKFPARREWIELVETKKTNMYE